MVDGPVAAADDFASVDGPWSDDDELASRPDFDAWFDGLVAADPEAVLDPAVIVAAGETDAVTPGLIVELAAVDPQSLSDSGRVGLMAAWARVENYAAARKVAAVADVAGPEPEHDLDAGAFAWAEVGAALRVGDGEATGLVDAARELTGRLGATFTAMTAGDVSWRKARSLIDHTARLDDADCHTVEARVLGRAAQRTPAQHQAAVRRAVDALDPAAADERRRQAKRDIALVRSHLGDGMGELYATMTSEEVEVVWLAADAHARRAKAAGDTRTLDQLRVTALIAWAEQFLRTGHPMPDGEDMGWPAPVDPDTGETASHTVDPATGELVPATPGPAAGPANPPRRHGRPLTINLTWDLTSFLGLTDHPGELLGPGVLIPPEAMRDLVEDAELRRLIFHPLTGHLVDLTPFAVRPPAGLAEYCAMRDVTPTTPTAGPSGRATSAGAGDIDHIQPRSKGGRTVRVNTHSPARRWHRAKTFAGWTVVHNDEDAWTWTSPAGRQQITRPHDYRLGP